MYGGVPTCQSGAADIQDTKQEGMDGWTDTLNGVRDGYYKCADRHYTEKTSTLQGARTDIV